MCDEETHYLLLIAHHLKFFMEKILSDFGVQPILLAAQVVNFLILFFILKKFLYRPILKMFETRKQTIAQSLKNAEEIEQRLLKTEEDREKKLRQASDEARKILDDATKSASGIVAEAHTKAALDMDIIFKKGEESIKQEKAKMQQEIREELANLVVLALQKVSGKVFNRSDQKNILQQTIKDLK